MCHRPLSVNGRQVFFTTRISRLHLTVNTRVQYAFPSAQTHIHTKQMCLFWGVWPRMFLITCNIHTLKEINIKPLHWSPVILLCLHEYSKLPPLINLIIFIHIHTCSLLFQISRDYRLEFISHLFPIAKWKWIKTACCFLCVLTFLIFRVHSTFKMPLKFSFHTFNCFSTEVILSEGGVLDCIISFRGVFNILPPSCV